MSPVIDYYIGPLSPWSYLGYARFTAIAKEARAEVRVLPYDMNAVFSVSGGLPLARRPAQRQAYRLVELERFSEFLSVPMNLHPKFFPAPPGLAAKLIAAVMLHDGQEAAMEFCGAVFAAVWAQERDISSAVVLAEIVRECGLADDRNRQALEEDVRAIYESNTEQTIEGQLFGAPTYVVEGEMFWGQDRLDFVERALKAHAVPKSLA